MNKKEEVAGGLVVATFFVSIAILIMFLRAPVGYYLGKWNGLFEDKNVITYNSYPEYQDKINGYGNAIKSCQEIVSKYF